MKYYATHRFGPDVEIAGRGKKKKGAMNTGRQHIESLSAGETHMLLNLNRSSARKGRMMLIARG
jgi:hypothetical protein